MNKSIAALLSTSFLVGAMVSVPVTTSAKTDEHKHQHSVDLATVNTERLIKALKAKGVIPEGATQEEIDEMVAEFLSDRQVPHGLDESTEFGKKLAKNQAIVQSKAVKNINNAKEGQLEAKFRNVHKDNIVIALVEYQDQKHNQLPVVRDSIWLEDFNAEHYDSMLFSPYGYRTPDGVAMTTMAQYYFEQSGGTWTVDGTVVPWTLAKNNKAYYGKNDENGNDPAPRELVVETLEGVGKSIAGKEDLYDQRDPYDIDGDGNVMEADGMLDNLMLVHAGVGEETGEDDDAIWSHRWTLRRPTAIPGTTLKAYDYMIQPEDGAPGVFAHEYGHNLGLPDLYDTSRNGHDSPVGAWSLMSSGSHTGKVFQTAPTGFDPWSKMWLQETYGGKWISPTVINHEDLDNKKKTVKINEAISSKPDGKLIKIDMPEVEKLPPTKPFEGSFSYFSDEGDNLDTRMTSQEIDLTGAKTATLAFDTYRQIETGYDYLYINVIDASGKKHEVKVWDDSTDGDWVNEEIDLSAYVGGKIKVEFNYVTDGGLALQAFYVDNITVTADGKTVFSDDAEGEKKFELDGFIHFDGKGKFFPAYYLVELRSQNGVDAGLKYFRRSDTWFTYDPGVLVWYYDGRFGKTQDNNTSNHPGFGMLGVVDSHQRVHYWNNEDGNAEKIADSRYQVLDAAFGFNKTSGIELDYIFGTMNYPALPGVDTFYDGNDYTMPEVPEIGKVLPEVGLQIKVKGISNDFTRAVVELSKK
ncbi:immune inhibitor A domain-containing protein [Brevibacillus dissolubilis]|uniref:immune inhibitor A domain-containing protein n=1 Tax=Brevibacillus dissolubilis TaxID=1844116 RepID=UPI001115CFB1|nr:immune inhibitor A domain-containing protein [Brevibacillus dissolubilis]